jgi:hypothetical protein
MLIFNNLDSSKSYEVSILRMGDAGVAVEYAEVESWKGPFAHVLREYICKK